MAMPRAPKSVQYNADAATIQRHFDEAMSLKKSQKEVSGEISTLNSIMQQDGCTPG
jgi:hypothetical protein